MSKRKRLSSTDVKIIKEAIDLAGGVRAGWRLLKEQGTPYGLGTVGKVNTQTDEDLQAQYASAKAQVESLKHRNIHLLKRLGDELEFNDEILAAVGALKPLKPLKRRPAKQPCSKIAVTSPLTDWHIGEVINEDEVEGLNKYDFEIATKRVEYLAYKLIDWVETQRHSYQIDDLYIPMLGDFISGNIHKGLEVTNEFPLPVAITKAAYLLSRYIGMLAPHFDRIVVDEIGADNHSRLNHKPQAKQKALNSYNYPIFELMEAYLSTMENITYTRHLSPKAQIDIGGQSFLCSHGDTVRGWMGMPYYGMVRENNREARKRMKYGKPFDETLRGHFHVAGFGEDYGILCGSLCGATELDALNGRFTLPYQVSFLVHPQYGWFNFCKWNLMGA
jgi:hypothetical protein